MHEVCRERGRNFLNKGFALEDRTPATAATSVPMGSASASSSSTAAAMPPPAVPPVKKRPAAAQKRQ
jgi:hypothetical protein